jgi:Flp pilus assembly protein CpaB
MGKRTLVLVIALGLAAASAFLIWNYLTSVESDLRGDLETVVVFRATERIDAGTTGEEARGVITEGTAAAGDVAFEGSRILCLGVKDGVDASVCDQNPRDLETLLSGKLAVGPISQGQLITDEMFVTPAELNSTYLSEAVGANQVAIAIRTDDESGIGGFVRPGDRVNLLASAPVDISSLIDLYKDPELRELITGVAPPETTAPVGTGENPDQVAQFVETFATTINFTQTVLQDLEVIAVGPDTSLDPLGSGLEPQGAQVVVLLVTPEQAEKIEFSKRYTSVTLTLLPGDAAYNEFEAPGVVVDDLFDLLDRIQEQVEASFGS